VAQTIDLNSMKNKYIKSIKRGRIAFLILLCILFETGTPVSVFCAYNSDIVNTESMASVSQSRGECFVYEDAFYFHSSDANIAADENVRTSSNDTHYIRMSGTRRESSGKRAHRKDDLNPLPVENNIAPNYGLPDKDMSSSINGSAGITLRNLKTVVLKN
jgi:hypothetical protein